MRCGWRSRRVARRWCSGSKPAGWSSSPRFFRGRGAGSSSTKLAIWSRRVAPRQLGCASWKAGFFLGGLVDAGRRAVSVIAFLQADQPMGVAVLTPASSPGDERRARLEPVEGARYCLAEFENVPDGSFSLRIERG